MKCIFALEIGPPLPKAMRKRRALKTVAGKSPGLVQPLIAFRLRAATASDNTTSMSRSAQWYLSSLGDMVMTQIIFSKTLPSSAVAHHLGLHPKAPQTPRRSILERLCRSDNQQRRELALREHQK